MLENRGALIENLISEEAKRHGLKAIGKSKIDKPLLLPKGLSQVKRN